MERALTNVPDEWRKIIEDPLLPDILAKVVQDDHVPSVDKIFEWARLTPYDKVHTVIIAQDPYPDHRACGLAFSCGSSASMTNIFKALLKSKLIRTEPMSAHLNKWAEQGVLLLNRALTTKKGVSNAHKSLWQEYTQNLICRLEGQMELTFLLLGNEAKSIRCKGRRLEYQHPSPLARGDFSECPHFKEININWDPEDREYVFTDGSCTGNGKKNAVGGFAIIFLNRRILIRGRLSSAECPPTSVRAEGLAILETFRYYKKHKLDNAVHIYTDSQFWIDMIYKYIPSWTEETRLTKRNPDLTKSIKKGWRIVGSNFMLRHVKAHGAESNPFLAKYNDIADREAKSACSLKEGEIEIVEFND